MMMKKAEGKLGFWAGILSAVFSLLWFVTFKMQDVFQAVPNWNDLQAYADAFHPVRLAYVYPSLLLALTFLIVLACIHRLVPEGKKIWTLIALAVGILYAAMASINYNIQAVAVRLSLAAGELGGLEMFIPDNTNSVFTALANSYVYMAISMCFAGFAFSRSKKERWIRCLLLAQAVTAVGQIGYSMFDFPLSLFIATSMIWVIGAPVVFFLLTGWFKNHSSVSE